LIRLMLLFGSSVKKIRSIKRLGSGMGNLRARHGPGASGKVSAEQRTTGIPYRYRYGGLGNCGLSCVGLALALLGATLLAYQPAWHGGRLWDDDAHITRPELRSALGLWRIWTEPGATQQYYPLTHSVFWLEYQLWGDHTLGYHLVNFFL